jgi:hypothetical protein
MEATMAAVEMTGIVDEQQTLHIDEPVPFPGPRRVRVIILYPSIDEWDEVEWLRAAAHNPAFDYLKDAEEDIYTLNDGVPFNDEV